MTDIADVERPNGPGAGACAGFWAGAIGAIGPYLVDLVAPVTTREAIHLILSAAIGSALITFAARERCGLRAG